MNSREAVTAMPFIYGLQLIGFTTYLGIEPEEYSGREVIPILTDVDRAQVVILTFVPTLLVRSQFYEMLIARCRDKPVFVLIFGPVVPDELAESYDFIKSVPENRTIRRERCRLSPRRRTCERDMEGCPNTSSIDQRIARACL